MRASNVTRRFRSVAQEEKKDDMIPNVTINQGSASKVRRRRKARGRNRLMTPAVRRLLVGLSPAIVVFFLLVTFFAVRDGAFPGKAYLRHLTVSRAIAHRVTLPISGKGIIRLPGHSLMHEDSSEDGPDYGELDHHSDFEESYEMREILWGPDEKLLEHYAPSEHASWWEDHDAYYFAFDDDENRNPYHGWDDDQRSKERHCRRNAFHRDLHVNCLNFHQLDLPAMTLDNGVRFVGAGSYRDVFHVERQTAADRDMVLKVAEISNNYDHEIYECMRMEGAVASQLSPHPLLVDIYGFCALSMFNEAMMEGDAERPAGPIYQREHCEETPKLDGPELVPMNNLTATTKLEWALNMAEGIALLHNFKNGLIVHDDVQLPQFMRTTDGRLKLGDFNRAEFMLYDEEHGEYCQYHNGHGHGDWRAPEEYHDFPLNEKIDIWSLGMNFYVLLTGVYPIYDECHESNVKKYIKEGIIPWIDPRWAENSFAEAELSKVIKDCWAYEPKDRPSIGELVVRLRKAEEENRGSERK